MALNLPERFVDRMRDDLGAEYPAFEAALNDDPIISLRMNPGKPGAQFPGGKPIPWAENGRYLAERPYFWKDPFIYAGGYYVQEASSMLISQMVDFEPGQRILDLCASPGGKSTLLASQMKEGSLLVANEVVRNRAAVLQENIVRWGDPRVVVTHNHPRDFLGLPNFFDLMFIDAPCSGEGMFRKDPKVISQWSPSMVRQCQQRQKDILTYAIHALKPGGKLVYSTCTYNAAENEDMVKWIVNHDPGMFRIVEVEVPAEWGLTPGKTEGYPEGMDHTYHCYPHKVQGEGFYLACLEKLRPGKSVPNPKSHRKSRGRGRTHERDAAPAQMQPLSRKEAEAMGQWLNQPEGYTLLPRREYVEAVPSHNAEEVQRIMERMNVLRAGITMGKVKGRDLVPDHDLALSEAVSADIPVFDMDLEQALRFLSRQNPEIETGDARGWALARYQGRLIGWMKVLEGRINNHLPKSLRIRSQIDFDELTS